MALPIHLGAWSMALMLRLPFELMNTVCLTPLSKFTFLWVCSGYCFYRALTGLCMKVQPDLDLALSKFTVLWVCSGYCFYRALTAHSCHGNYHSHLSAKYNGT